MRTLFLTLLIASATCGSFAKNNRSVTPSPTPQPELVPVADGNSAALDSMVALNYSNGWIDSLLDLSVTRKLDESNVSAVGTIRLVKSLSSSDSAQDLEVREANISLSEPWFSARAGRMDLSDLVSTTRFFGRYPLMGQRRLDGIKVYIPFNFTFGLADDKKLSSPPTSLNFFYFPTLLSADNAVLDGSQGFFLGQARMKLDLGPGLKALLLVNLGTSFADYFTYGSLSGNPAYSVCGEADLAHGMELYFEYGVQDSAHSFDTNAFTFGGRMENLFTLEFLTVEEVVFETQVPLASNLNNPFTGGNGINPLLATLPQMAWYAKARIRIRAIFIDFNITNSVNDFTLARLNQTNTNTPLNLPVGFGNETGGLELPLSASDYAHPSFSIDMGVQF